MKRIFSPGLTAFWAFFFLGVIPGCGLCQASAPTFDAEPIKVIAIITKDDQGNPLRFPSSVFFDDVMDEIYVINGGRGRIVIYGNDYFPRLSIGAGRGITSPQGIYVDRCGRVYVCQSRSAKKPPRITVLNAALFPEKEITFKDIPGARGFTPLNITINKNGRMYVAGHGVNGALVFDSEGKFLHILSPMDRVIGEKTEISRDALKKHLKGGNNSSKISGQDVQQNSGKGSGKHLLAPPPELIPKNKIKKTEETETFEIAPVSIIDAACDADGRIYLLSEETSKVYVYSPDEKFLFSFGHKGGSSGKMSRPRSLAVDSKRKHIYVVDYMRHTVLVYNMHGKYITEIGGMGWGPGWFNYPTSITLDSKGHLIIADLFNQRVQVLESRIKAHMPSSGSSTIGPQGSPPVPSEKPK